MKSIPEVKYLCLDVDSSFLVTMESVYGDVCLEVVTETISTPRLLRVRFWTHLFW